MNQPQTRANHEQPFLAITYMEFFELKGFLIFNVSLNSWYFNVEFKKKIDPVD